MKIDDEIERLIKAMNSCDKSEAVLRQPVTFWLPANYKEQYDIIQARSRRKFSKVVVEIIMLAIDQVNGENKDAA
jgi:hypothetical protein